MSNKPLKWVSTFPGVHHLKGGNPFLNVSLEEMKSGAWVRKTTTGTFTGEREVFYGTLEECKAKGEEWKK